MLVMMSFFNFTYIFMKHKLYRRKEIAKTKKYPFNVKQIALFGMFLHLIFEKKEYIF